MSKPKCTPLKITAVLADGRINSADGIIMLDAILYHAWFIKYAPQVLEGIYDESKIGYIGLPLKQLEGNRYAASKGIYEEVSNHIEYYNRRPDFFSGDKINYLDMDKGKISDSVGLYRAYRNPNLIRIVKDSRIVFYAVGHKEEVQELLNLMIAVGKKPSMGYGFVKKWIVEDFDEDYTIEHPQYGLMRPIEVEKSDKKYDCPIMNYGIRPPYWKPQNMRLCYVPIKGVEQ